MFSKQYVGVHEFSFRCTGIHQIILFFYLGMVSNWNYQVTIECFVLLTFCTFLLRNGVLALSDNTSYITYTITTTRSLL